MKRPLWIMLGRCIFAAAHRVMGGGVGRRARFLSLAGQVGALLAATLLGASLAAAEIELPAAAARIREVGRITPEGAFSFWNDGAIGDRFVARAQGTGELRFSARGVAVNGEWPLVAVELTQAESGMREVAKISVNSAGLREFRQEIQIPAKPFELRLHQLNRPAGGDPKSLRHLVLTKFSLSNVERLEGSLLEASLFGAKGTMMEGPPRRVHTKRLEAEIWPASGVWRVADGDLGCRLDRLHCVLHAGGRAIEPESDRAECVIEEDVDAIIGPATRVALRYPKPGGVKVDYTLWFSREGHEVAVRLDFTNDTAGKVKLAQAAPVVCGSASLGSAVSFWAAVGDAKENSGAHQLVECGSMQNLEAWWHVAVKNRATGRGLLAGSLTNRKGLGRFLLCRGDERSLRLAGYSDYEGIEMPVGARIEGEPFLLCFGPSGNAVLERFGELVAKANGIHEPPRAADGL